MTNSDLVQLAIDQFEALLQDPDSLEQAWQELFSNFPFILTDCLPLGISPHQLIPCKPGQAQADFFFFPKKEDPISSYGVIEIKRPQTQILTKPRKDVICLSRDLSTAVAQARKYSIEIEAKIVRTRSQQLILGNELHMFIIAGLSEEIAQKATSEIHKLQLDHLLPSDCRLIPFDALRESLASKVPPRIHALVPQYLGLKPSIPLFSRHTRYKGDWRCAKCGAPITELYMIPDPDRLDRLLCRNCHAERVRAHRR